MDRDFEKRLAATGKAAHDFAKAQCSDTWISRHQDDAYVTVRDTLRVVLLAESTMKQLALNYQAPPKDEE